LTAALLAVGYVSGISPAVLAPTAALCSRDQAASPQDQRGDLLRGGAGDLWQHQDVGVSGEHDAGMA